MHSILVVDDSASMRQMISFTLKRVGFTIVEAVDGQDGLEKSGTCEFSLVLTDQGMPRLDGIGLTKRLRANPKFTKVPIVIMASDSHSSLKEVGRAAGHTCWLAKPFDPAHLLEVVRKIVR